MAASMENPWATNTLATASAVIFSSGTTRVENRSQITRKKRCPLVDMTSGPRISIATNYNGLFAGKNFISVACARKFTRSLAHAWQFLQHLLTSGIIPGQ